MTNFLMHSALERDLWGLLGTVSQTFLLKLFYPLLRKNTKMTTLPTLSNYGETRICLLSTLHFCVNLNIIPNITSKLTFYNGNLFYETELAIVMLCGCIICKVHCQRTCEFNSSFIALKWSILISHRSDMAKWTQVYMDLFY